MQKIYEVSQSQLMQLVGICRSTLLLYMECQPFNKIPRKYKMVKLFKTGRKRKFVFYSITAEEIDKLRKFKRHRLRADGVL